MASISPPSVNNENYDPKVDKARKANSNDLGWKYEYWANLQKPDKVTCTLCDTEVSGGIKRLKQHLAGGYGDAKICPKTTTAIRKEMRDYLESNNRRRPLFNEEDDEPPEEPADVVVATAASNTKAKPKVNKSIVEMLRKTPEELVDERRKGCSQPTIPAKIRTKEEKHYVDQQWALWFYECGVPFNAAAARQFEIAVEATAQFGSGEPLLKDAVKLTSSMREEHEQAWKMYGCTLMSDGWTDKRGRHLINFLVNSPSGTYFLESVDALSEVHDAFMLADLLEAKIEEIGEDKVVQVITDNGANYKAAGRILMERISTLYWSPCAAHCLDLMLEEIGNLKEFKKPIARAKRVTTFIYRHGRILSLMREKTGADLVRPAATRFATSFLTLKSLHKHRDALKALFVSEEWLGNKLAKTAAGQEVHNTVLSMEFWNLVEDCLRASAPLLIVLRVVDGDERPAMPEVAALVNHAKEKIKLSFATENKKTLLKNIIKIIEKRWVTQMDHPLYGAALYLNPERLHSLIQANDDATVGQLRGCFLDVLGRMVEDEEIRSKIDAQSLDYEGLRGDAFSNKMAKQNLQNLNPLDWWRSYGGRAIELQRFARRIMHTKKRNRLLHKRLNDIVFVSYNWKMKIRFQLRREKKEKNFDSLVIEEFDWDNEWADSSYVHPQGARGCDNGDNGNGLTWKLVDEAVGASSSLRGRNLPRNASSKRARNGQSRLAELEEDLGLANEEEEEEDPHDDADVSDCEQDPNGSNGGGENMEGPNILDEFDDGY
ncbi:unnamed protein product [Miscanthus lutarioriparius]|uniref:DUF659 domain-containing protein n=1 Tax=Miscanthus lutarioriparius TaxID=422564 RepID=A0A811M442_9POAL|nr:unnamed protein product [Miscanthus lutarioriparius]